jgi:hypothetical protein
MAIDMLLKIPRIRTRVAMALSVLTGRAVIKGDTRGEWYAVEVDRSSTPGKGNATFYSFYPSGGFFCRARGTAPIIRAHEKPPTRKKVVMANGGGTSFYDPAMPGHRSWASELRIVVVPDTGVPYVLNPEPM